MKRMQSLLFQQFGKWKVLAKEPDHGINTKNTVWRCVCACGEIRQLMDYQLRAGRTRSCRACAMKERWAQHYASMSEEEFAAEKAAVLERRRARTRRNKRAMKERARAAAMGAGTYVKPSRLVDMAGRRVGKWLVLERARTRGGKSYWKCQCDCGRVSEVDSRRLRVGQSTQCKMCASRVAVAAAIKARRERAVQRWVGEAAE